jgi:hypothetical protein
MSIEDIIQDKITSALADLDLRVRIDSEGDLVVSLRYNGEELSNDYVAIPAWYEKEKV